VLHHYLGAMRSPPLADAAVLQLQEPLTRLEHAIRAVQARLLPPDALSALDALVCVYAQLLRLDGRAGATHSWLMARLGCGVRARSARAGDAAGEPDTVCASDTLQLLLDVLRTRPFWGAGAGGSGGGGGGALPSGSPGRPRRGAAGGFSSGAGSGSSVSGCGGGAGAGGSAAAAVAAAGGVAAGGFTLSRLGVDSISGGGGGAQTAGRGGSSGSGSAGGSAGGGMLPRDEAQLRLVLWRFMTELVQFALRHPNVKTLGELVMFLLLTVD